VKASDYRQAAAAAMSEDTLEEAVRDLAKGLGILRYHTWNSRNSPAGWVDDVLIGRRGVLFRELKKTTGTVTPKQVECHQALRNVGLDIDVWRPEDLTSGRIARELAAIA